MDDLITLTMKYQKKNYRSRDRFCYIPVEALRLVRNRTSRSATGLPNALHYERDHCIRNYFKNPFYQLKIQY